MHTSVSTGKHTVTASASPTEQAEAEVVVLNEPMVTQDAPSSSPNAFF